MIKLLLNPSRMRRRRRRNARGVPFSGSHVRIRSRSRKSGRSLPLGALQAVLRSSWRRAHKKNPRRRRRYARRASNPRRRRRRNEFGFATNPRRRRRRSRARSSARNPRRRRRARGRRRNVSRFGYSVFSNPRRRRRSRGRRRNPSYRRGRRRRNPFGISVGSIQGMLTSRDLWTSAIYGGVGGIISIGLGSKLVDQVLNWLPMDTAMNLGGASIRPWLDAGASMGVGAGLGILLGNFVSPKARTAVFVGTGVLVVAKLARDLLAGTSIGSMLGLTGLGEFSSVEYGMRGMIPGAGLGEYSSLEYGVRGMIPGAGLGRVRRRRDPIVGFYGSSY